jgi:hypothetical protein
MAAGLGAAPSYPILETGAFAAMLARNIFLTFFFIFILYQKKLRKSNFY